MNERVKICNADCMEYMKNCEDASFDLAVVDPPYFSGPNGSGYYGKGYSSLGVQRNIRYKTIENWEIPTAEYFRELTRVSKHQIIWGANHFSGLFDSSSSLWLVWNKENGQSTFADCELAYTSFKGACRMFTYMWRGMHQGKMGGNKKLNETRIHPTQKPVKLYSWLFSNFAQPGHKVLDTHLGSGSSAIAAYYAELEFTGLEIDPHYFALAEKRISNETSQLAIDFDAL